MCPPVLVCSVLSRVGDRPTATILQVQFHFLEFCLVFKTKYLTKICPSQKDQLYLKMEGRRSRPSNLLYIYPFQEGHILVEYFALKSQCKKSKKLNSSAESQQLSYFHLFTIFSLKMLKMCGESFNNISKPTKM